jgi:hypothetical protein
MEGDRLVSDVVHGMGEGTEGRASSRVEQRGEGSGGVYNAR